MIHNLANGGIVFHIHIEKKRLKGERCTSFGVTKRSETLGIIFDRAQSVHFLTFRFFFFFFLTFMKLSNYLNLNKIDTIAKGCTVNIVKFLRTRLGGHNPFKLNVLH